MVKKKKEEVTIVAGEIVPKKSRKRAAPSLAAIEKVQKKSGLKKVAVLSYSFDLNRFVK